MFPNRASSTSSSFPPHCLRFRSQIPNADSQWPSHIHIFSDEDYQLPAQITISSANPTRGFRTTAYIGYAQDEWRVDSRLVLNLGLRYELDTPITEVNGLLSNLLPGCGNFVVGSDELPRLHNIDKNNFAPRVGFAYRVTDDG